MRNAVRPKEPTHANLEEKELWEAAHEVLQKSSFGHGIPTPTLSRFEKALKRSDYGRILDATATLSRLRKAPGASIEYHNAWVDLNGFCNDIISSCRPRL